MEQATWAEVRGSLYHYDTKKDIYNKKNHKDVKVDDIFCTYGDMFTNIKVIEYRMKFGKLRILISQVKIILPEVFIYVYTAL